MRRRKHQHPKHQHITDSPGNVHPISIFYIVNLTKARTVDMTQSTELSLFDEFSSWKDPKIDTQTKGLNILLCLLNIKVIKFGFLCFFFIFFIFADKTCTYTNTTKNSFPVRVADHWNRLPREVVVCSSGDIPDLPGHFPVPSALGNCFRGVWAGDSPVVLSNPYNSVIVLFFFLHITLL